MTRRKTTNLEGQGQIFDPDLPAPPQDLEHWVEHMKELDTAADLENIPHVDIKERRANLLNALGMLSSISRLGGLNKATTRPELSAVRQERAQHYPSRVFETKVAPRSRAKRVRDIGDIEPVLDKVFGDPDQAYDAVLAGLTPGQKAHELNRGGPKVYPDRDELSIAFRAKFAGPNDGAANRQEMNNKLLGKKSRRDAA